MPKRRKGELGAERTDVGLEQARSRHGGFVPIIIPTQSERHTTGIRLGAISAEIFCKKPERRRELGLPAIYVEP